MWGRFSEKWGWFLKYVPFSKKMSHKKDVPFFGFGAGFKTCPTPRTCPHIKFFVICGRFTKTLTERDRFKNVSH